MMKLLRIKLQYIKIKMMIKSAKMKGCLYINVRDIFPMNIINLKAKGYKVVHISTFFVNCYIISWGVII